VKNNPNEIEVKFYLKSPDIFCDRLNKIGAILTRARCHEINLLFDDNAGSLNVNKQILRLRKDSQVLLTYKGKGEVKDDVLSRREIEVIVSDFEATRELLEMLGYQPHMTYEKYRTAYDLFGCEIVLDELPYGWFCEIEGQKPRLIQTAAKKIGLYWDARIIKSYRMLFDDFKQNKGMIINDLTFANFKGIQVIPEDLGVKPADTVT
jgi:adenylate cyclase, class 2